MADVLQVQKRESTGSAAAKRLRRSGLVPAILYGHGETNENLAVPEADVKTLVRHHGKMVELKGAVEDTALVSEMQWDPMGIEVLHLDLLRVDLSEKVQVTVPINSLGEAAGVREGGVFIENLHEVDIRCPAGSIPDSIGLNVSDMQVGDFLTAADLELPADVELVTSPDTTVAHVEVAREAVDEVGVTEEGGAGAEPEVIAKGGPKEEED